MTSGNAARPSGAGAGDGDEQHHHLTSDPPCACGAPSKARVEARVLNGLAILAVPVCDAHIPSDPVRAERIIAATLIAIAQVASEANVGSGARGRRRCRHA